MAASPSSENKRQWLWTHAACALGGAAVSYALLRWRRVGNAAPRLPIDPSKKIGTHSGSFHADEALACYMLRMTDEFCNAAVVRSRDPAVLDPLPVLVDVGAVYDPEKRRFDHHQRGFNVTLSERHTMKLSSAGLIYKHYGREIIKKITAASDTDVDAIFYQVYEDFVEAMDGIDNGVLQYPSDVKARYTVKTDLSSRVRYLNPSSEDNVTEEQTLECFYKAMQLTGEEFVDAVQAVFKTWLPSRTITREAINARFRHDKSGRTILFEKHCSWKNHIHVLEEELKVEQPILYVLFEDVAAKAWRVQAVPQTPDSFLSRKPLPEPWRGLRDDQLSTVSGIPGCIFAHASGFIGGNKTFDGALRMALAAVEHVEGSAAAAPAANK